MAISDRESAEAWLQGKPREVQVAFAARCALRALPGIGTVDEATLGVLVLRVLRATLTSGVAAARLTPEVEAVARFASADSAALSSAASLTLRSVESAALSSLTARSTALSSAAFLTALSSVRSASADSAALSSVAAASLTARSSARSANAATFSAADEDAQRYETDTPEFVFRLPLWHAVAMPDEQEAALGKLREFWEADPETWGFWARWYEGMLEEGAPPPWELLEQVALIPDADWQKGPEHVAGLIAEIEARLELKLRIRELEGELASASANRRGIGGNNPPEPIEDAPSISQEFIVIWEPVRELKAEVESEEPDSSKISSAISKLNALVAVCGKWTGGKLDAAATEYVKAIGKWGGGATTVWLASQHPKVVSLMEAAERWLAALY